MQEPRLFRLPRFRRFRKADTGAVTVDYVVLTAAVVTMVLALFSVLTEAIFEETAQSIVEDMQQAGNY